MSTVSNEPIYKVGMTVRVTEKLPGTCPGINWPLEGKVTDVLDNRIFVKSICFFITDKSQFNIQILGPMAAETKAFVGIRTCCNSWVNDPHKDGCPVVTRVMGINPCEDYPSPGLLPRVDPNCPECKGTGTWTNPANAVTTPCSMGCK